MSVKLETIKNNMSPYMIETGTYEGNTTKKCIQLGFEKIFTIELQSRLYETSILNLKEYIDNGKVEALLGDSSEKLPKILTRLDRQCTILLDAHIDGGNYISGITPEIHRCPLYNELIAIKEHKINTHIIIIDDVRILGKEGWGTEVVLDKIIELIKSINPDYTITFDDGECENDVLIAKI